MLHNLLEYSLLIIWVVLICIGRYKRRGSEFLPLMLHTISKVALLTKNNMKMHKVVDKGKETSSSEGSILIYCCIFNLYVLLYLTLNVQRFFRAAAAQLYARENRLLKEAGASSLSTNISPSNNPSFLFLFLYEMRDCISCYSVKVCMPLLRMG